MNPKDVKSVAVSTLVSDPANVRKHGTRNLETIKQSLERFGQQKPLVVDADGVVIAGNGTLAAAIALGWTKIAVVKTSLTGEAARAFAIADNRAAELAEWDTDALTTALQQLSEDMQECSGFTVTEIADMTNAVLIEGEPSNPRFDPDQYANRVLKQIVLIFGLTQYDRVFDALASYAEKHGLSDNSEVVMHLLEKNGYAISERSTPAAE